MARITWELDQTNGRWLGKVGARVAFTVKPGADNQSWDIVFNWVDVTYDGFPNLTSTREAAERKLIIFAEQTGITLPEEVEVEEEPTLAQRLTRTLGAEMQWFKAEDSPERRTEYLATQALIQIEKLVRKHRDAVDDEIKDPEYHGAVGVLRDLIEEVWEAQEELGLEVDREWPED